MEKISRENGFEKFLIRSDDTRSSTTSMDKFEKAMSDRLQEMISEFEEKVKILSTIDGKTMHEKSELVKDIANRIYIKSMLAMLMNEVRMINVLNKIAERVMSDFEESGDPVEIMMKVMGEIKTAQLIRDLNVPTVKRTGIIERMIVSGIMHNDAADTADSTGINPNED